MSGRLDPFLDALSDGVVLSDRAGTVLYMNPAARRMLDVPERPAETLNSCRLVCGKLFEEGSRPCAETCALRDPSSTEKAVRFLGRHGPREAFSWKGETLSRDERWAHLRVRCVKSDGPLWGMPAEERHFILIEDASAELELGRRREEWRRMAAHDLRSPLTGILAALREVQECPPGVPLPEGERRLVDSAVAAARRMSSLIEQFLDAPLLEDGRLAPRLSTVRLAPLVERCLAEARPRAAGKGVELASEGDASVRGDEALLERALANLLDNALRYAPRGGCAAAVVSSRGPSVELSVADTGPGVSAEGPHGRGLGLAFCRAAARAMGGDLEIWSETGRGSVFTLRLTGAEEAS